MKMNKFFSIVISVFIALSLMVYFPMVNLVNAATYDDYEFDLLRADMIVDPYYIGVNGTLKNALEADSPGVVLYENMTQNLVLLSAMATWKTDTFEPSSVTETYVKEIDYYETIILKSLDQYYNSSIIQDTFDNECATNVKKVWSAFNSNLKLETGLSVEPDKVLKNFSTLNDKDKDTVMKAVKKSYSKVYPGLDMAGKCIDVYFDTAKIFEITESTFSSFCSYASCYYMTDSVKNVVRKLYEKCDGASDLQFKLALKNVLNACEDYDLVYSSTLFDTSLNTFSFIYGKTTDGMFDAIISSNPALFGLNIGRNIGKNISNILFSTDEICEQYFKLQCLTKYEILVKSVIQDIMRDYSENRNLNDAHNLFASIDIFFQNYSNSCEMAITYSEIVFTKGWAKFIPENYESQSKYVSSVKNIKKVYDSLYADMDIAYYSYLEDLYPEMCIFLKESKEELSNPTKEIVSESEMREKVEYYGKIVDWAYYDYDNDGYKEAFATIGNEYDDYETIIEFIVFVNCYGSAKIMRNNFWGVYSNYNGIADYQVQNRRYFAVSTTQGGYAAKSYIYSVVYGEARELLSNNEFAGFYVENERLYGFNWTHEKGGLGTDDSEFFYNEQIQNLEQVNNPLVEGSCYTFNTTTGLLTLRGNVNKDEMVSHEGFGDIRTLGDRYVIKSVIAEKGTVLPEDCSYLFSYYENCETIDLSEADTSNVRNMNYMFSYCFNLTFLDVSSFDTRNVESMCEMFYYCSSLVDLELNNFDTSNVEYMYGMFECCSNLVKLELNNFDTSNVEYMCGMFYGCWSLTSIDLSSFDTRNVKYMNGMFEECSSLVDLELNNFDTSNVEDMSAMFLDCWSLSNLELNNFNTSNVRDTNNMFGNCRSLSKLQLGKNSRFIESSMCLSNEYGWANIKEPTVLISGNKEYAEFANSGTNTYIWLHDVTTTTTQTTSTTTTTTTQTETTTTEATTTTTTTTQTETTTTEATATTTTTTTPPTDTVFYGDPNLDETITVSDIILINKAIINSANLSPQAIRNCDLNGNGELDSMDAVYMLWLLVNKISVSDLPIRSA